MKKIIVFIFSSVFLLSCSLEYRAIKSFEENIPNTNIMLLMPDDLLKTNAKSELNYDEIKQSDYDSLIEISDFLHKFDDSTFKIKFKTALESEFENINVKVYFENQWKDFHANYNDSNKDLMNFIIMDFKQIEIEEKFIEELFEEYHGDLYYKETLIINALSLNSWVNISVLDSNFRNENLVFFTSTIKDDVDAAFKPELFSLEADFLYKIDSIADKELNSIHNLAAKELVYNSFNFLVNNYMDILLLREKGRLPDYYSKFNSNISRVYPVYEKPDYYVIKKGN